jgi:hypothetical protein
MPTSFISALSKVTLFAVEFDNIGCFFEDTFIGESRRNNVSVRVPQTWNIENRNHAPSCSATLCSKPAKLVCRSYDSAVNTAQLKNTNQTERTV